MIALIKEEKIIKEIREKNRVIKMIRKQKREV